MLASIAIDAEDGDAAAPRGTAARITERMIETMKRIAIVCHHAALEGQAVFL
jgi:hypothetical protein